MTVSAQKETSKDELYVPRLINADGRAPILLICEHATNYIPDEFNGLGLEHAAVKSHAAWDLGALDVACQLAQKLDAPLISASVSRLLYDCNRSPEASDAIPPRSEIYDIPGNQDLSVAKRQQRVGRIYEPFYTFIDEFLNRSPKIAAIITIHSFTPVYNGLSRAVEIGLLHDEDPKLATAILSKSTSVENLQIKLNEPYSSTDGVTHTLNTHGTKRGLLTAMVEIKNDLIRDAEEVEYISSHLSEWIVEALHVCGVRVVRGV